MPLIGCLKLVCGKGINDAPYEVTKNKRVNGKNKTYRRCKFYDTWRSMITRCYHTKAITTTYNGCSVCEEWLTFSNFKSWMEQQDWEGNDLDKDLLVENNKIYSPKTCCFVTKEVNYFMGIKNKGQSLVGVFYDKGRGKYQAKISKSEYSPNPHLGRFDCEYLAHRAWQEAKLKVCNKLVIKYKDTTSEAGLKRIQKKLENALADNKIIYTLQIKRTEQRNIQTITNLCKRVRKELPEKDIWCWTGHEFEYLKNNLLYVDFLDSIDVLVDGKFVKELYNPNLKWKGSANQRVIDVEKSLAQNEIVLYDA